MTRSSLSLDPLSDPHVGGSLRAIILSKLPCPGLTPPGAPAQAYPSPLRLPPPVLPRLGFGAEPGFSLRRGDDGRVVIPLAGEVVDPLAGLQGDVPLDLAPGW